MARREWIDRDFYGDLGVAADATAEQIEAAHRALTGELPSGERLEAVTQAYQVLSDPATRGEYDDVRELFGDGEADAGAQPDPESDDEADEADESDEGADGEDEALPVGADTTPPPGQPLRRWIAAGVLALGVIGAGYEGWLLYAHHQRTVAAAQALEAAEKYTLTLTAVDPNALDKNFADVIDGATGDFKETYARSSEQLRRLLIENKATAHGTVIDAAVKSATKNKVEVVLFVDQSVSNKAAPGPQLDRSRIVMTMEKVDGRWLAAKVDMP